MIGFIRVYMCYLHYTNRLQFTMKPKSENQDFGRWWRPRRGHSPLQLMLQKPAFTILVLGFSSAEELMRTDRPTKVMAQKLVKQGLFLTREEWDRPHIIPTPQHQ